MKTAVVCIGVALAVIALIPSGSIAAPPTDASTPAATAATLYVSPTGADSNSGAAPTQPLRTIQAALNAVRPGMTIRLAAGVYREQPATLRHGTAAARITIAGPEMGRSVSGRYQAVLYGTGRIFNVNHSYYTLRGFTIDGQEALRGMTFPTSLTQVRAFKDRVQDRAKDGRLIYLGSAVWAYHVTGVVIDDMFLNGGGGECVRLRSSADHNRIVNSVIQWCGMYGAGDDVSTYRYHSGEGVYIGTSPKSTDQPMYANDDSQGNVVQNNLINTFGSECFGVKENTHDNHFIGNDCRNNDEPLAFNGSNIEVRGYNTRIIGNTLSGSRGYGIKLNSDSAVYRQGGNRVETSAFTSSAGAPIYNNQVTAQGFFCGNTFEVTVAVQGRPVGDPRQPCSVISSVTR